MTTAGDVAAQLQTAGVGTVGTNIFRGGMRPPSGAIPHACIFVLPSGGSGPFPFLEGPTGNDYFRPRVQVLIRGNVGAYIATQTTAQSVFDAIHKSSITGFFQCLASNPEPLYLGLDDSEHPMFSVNFELHKVA